MSCLVWGVRLFNKVPVVSRPCGSPGVLAKMYQVLSLRLLRYSPWWDHRFTFIRGIPQAVGPLSAQPCQE